MPEPSLSWLVSPVAAARQDVASPPAAASESLARARRRDSLETEKLAVELHKARLEAQQLEGVRGQAALLTTLLGIAAVAGGAWRYFRDRGDERRVRAEAQVARLIELLGSDTPNARVAGAAGLQLLARSADPALRRLGERALEAQLRLAPEPRVQHALVRAFGALLQANGGCPALDGTDLDLRGLRLAGPPAGHHYTPAPSLEGAQFTRTRLDEAALERVRLDGARFEHVTGAKALSLRGSSVRGARFADCELAEVRFDGCDLRDATFARCELVKVRFDGCDLRGAIFHTGRHRSPSFTSAIGVGPGTFVGVERVDTAD